MEAAGLERHDGPSAARVYDALRGGHQGLAADRALADDLEAACPGLRDLVAVQRRFVLKAARWSAAVLGISQFIDAGAGFPATPAVHGEVRQAEPGAAVAYVDCDPEAAVVLRAAYQGLKGIAVTEGDVTDPGAVLADEGLRGVIDLGEPACVIFGGTLSSLPADVACVTAAGFARRLAPGSAAVISCFSYADEALAGRMAGTFAGAGPFHSHDAETIAGFFEVAGLRIVHGRIMDLSCSAGLPADGTGQTGVRAGRDRDPGRCLVNPPGGGPWPGARPYVREAQEPGEPADGLTREWSEAMAEAMAMRAAMVAAETGAPRHARRHAFPGALARGTAVVLILLGTLLVAAGAAVREWTT